MNITQAPKEYFINIPTKTLQVFRFQDLDEEVQDKLIEKKRQSNAGDDWWVDDSVYDVVQALEIMGFEVEKKRNRKYAYDVHFNTYHGNFSLDGRYYYKPGAVKLLKDDRRTDTELHRVAQGLVDAQKKHFYKLWANLSHHYGIEVTHSDRSWDDDFPDMKGGIEDVYQWALSNLRSEEEWYSGEHNARQRPEEDDVWYLANGKVAPAEPDEDN